LLVVAVAQVKEKELEVEVPAVIELIFQLVLQLP
jgi:hypothetical protein|tara:strand:- start:608 stop:709 length:102 start_codon:yes stop_codon:yes gene_type:complete